MRNTWLTPLCPSTCTVRGSLREAGEKSVSKTTTGSYDPTWESLNDDLGVLQPWIPDPSFGWTQCDVSYPASIYIISFSLCRVQSLGGCQDTNMQYITSYTCITSVPSIYPIYPLSVFCYNFLWIQTFLSIFCLKNASSIHLIKCVLGALFMLGREGHQKMIKNRTSFGGPMVKNPPANAGNTGLISGLGRYHMPRGS